MKFGHVKNGMYFCIDCSEFVDVISDGENLYSPEHPMKIFFSYGHDTHAEIVKMLADEVEKESNGAVENKALAIVWRDFYV